MKVTKGCAASSPAPIRIVVPEFPASMTSPGSENRRTPGPSIRSSVADRSSIETPSARIIVTVRRVSSEDRNPRILLSPPAREANRTDLWLIDLSPGTPTVPSSPPVRFTSDPVPGLFRLSKIGEKPRPAPLPDEPGQPLEAPPVVRGGAQDLGPVLEDDILPHPGIVGGA